MSIKPVTYYEVTCDEPGCNYSTSDNGSDFSAWSEAEGARSDWIDSDGIVLDDGRAFCEEHSLGKICDGCDRLGFDIAEIDGDYFCPACAETEGQS